MPPFIGDNGGTVVADETYIGGKPANKHRQGTYGKRRHGPGKGTGAGGNADKTSVLSLVDKTTGEVRSAVVPDVTGATLSTVISEHVNVPTSTLHTDRASQYAHFGTGFVDHQSVDHSSYEDVRGEVSTNQAESFLSQLKCGIDGTPPPRLRATPAPLPRPVRLPLHQPGRLRHRADAPAHGPCRWPSAELPASARSVSGQLRAVCA